MTTRTLIMAIPWDQQRLKRAVQLSKQTEGEIVWDKTHNAFDTFRLVLEAAGNDAVIILEDDVALAPNWREKIERGLEGHRHQVVQFFSLRGETESHLEPGRTFLMNQCYYLPEGYAAELLEFTADWVEKNPKYKTGYDIAMGAWLKSRREGYWMHVPSLVQHEKWVSEINSKRPRNRQSKVFDGGEE